MQVCQLPIIFFPTEEQKTISVLPYKVISYKESSNIRISDER